MSKTILVPLDGSPLAEHALPYATALARSIEACLVLLHARWIAALPAEGTPDLQAIAAGLRADGVAVDTHVCPMLHADDAGRAILGAATDLGPGHLCSGKGSWRMTGLTEVHVVPRPIGCFAPLLGAASQISSSGYATSPSTTTW